MITGAKDVGNRDKEVPTKMPLHPYKRKKKKKKKKRKRKQDVMTRRIESISCVSQSCPSHSCCCTSSPISSSSSFSSSSSSSSSSSFSSSSSSSPPRASPLPPSPPPPPPPSSSPHPTPPPRRLLVLLLLLSLLQNHLGLMADAFRDNPGMDDDKEASLVEVVSGFNASLPCIIRIPANDAPLLTLWYIGEAGTPVYSYDQRTGVSGTSWADPRVFGGRAHYLAHLSPPAMLIMRVGVKDANIYRCRIDFHNSNSREAWVRLKVIVPPQRVEIIQETSPVLPGQRDDVVCTAIGGTPSPSVVWLQKGRIVDPNSTVGGKSGSFNRLEVPASREDLRSPFTCKASNNDLTPPVFAVYTRNVTCGPNRILLEASENPLAVGTASFISCTAFGSNPPAKVTWYHQGKVIQNLLVNVTRQESGETVSVLSLQPGRHDHGRQLLCRAENPSLPLETLEDIITLNVAYRPFVSINVGWPRRLELLTEGSDLFLECIVDANPPPYKIHFFHNGVALNPNTSESMMMNDATLAIQHVSRDNSGDYFCKASNVQGDSLSKNITINVRYVPVCGQNASLVVGASLGEMTSLKCVLDAHPTDVNFTWMFVSDASGGEGGGRRPRIIDSDEYSCEGLTSILDFSPRSMKDFGVFSCYGSNKNGIQQQPCTFTVVPAGPPEGVKNCSILKVTSHEIAISCRPEEFDGGYPPQFVHQVRLASTGELVLNRSSSEASLEVSSLQPGKRYVVSVTSFNARGRAHPRSFHIQTLQQAKMHISLPSRPQEPKKFVWILGVGVGIVLTVGVLLGALWMARGRRSSHTLRNRDVDDVKPNNNAELTGEVRGMNDGLCVNGLMQQTIYDSTGKYRGFAHIQQNQQSFSVMSSTTSASGPPSATSQQPQQQPEKPSLQSRLSLLRRDSPLSRGFSKAQTTDIEKKGTKEEGEVVKNSKNTETGETKGKDAADAQQQESKEGEDGDEMNKKGFVKWKWVVNHVAKPSEGNRFLDLCRLAQSKHSQDQTTKNSESAL